MVRTASDLIDEIGHDLDEIVMGWSQKEDWRIRLGINDARRELEEARELLAADLAQHEAEFDRLFRGFDAQTTPRGRSSPAVTRTRR
jgi:hypothetical protein